MFNSGSKLVSSNGACGVEIAVRQPSSTNNNNEVHITTQPQSLPCSPISSPRPSSVQSNDVVVCTSPSSQSPTPEIPTSTVVVVRGNDEQSEVEKPQHSINYVVQVGYSNNTSLSEHSTTNDNTHDQDWQTTKICIRDRNASMCNNELMADVYFVVNNNGGPSTRFPCHKYVLATGSSVFYAMFFGSLAETGKEIVVTDVEPDAFLKMLKYLYADEISLDEDSVCSVLFCAKKYIIPYLARACVQFMEASLNARNVCILLSQSLHFDELELAKYCWDLLDAQAEMALNSEGFMDIDHDTLKSILSRETLNCKEIHVWNAGVAWATAECERREIEPSPLNVRAALDKVITLIRIPTMELSEFADGPAQSDILSLQESHDIFLHFTASVKPKVHYPINPREGLKPQICHRFLSSAYRSNQWRYRGRCDSIQFCVDRRIFIIGFGLYGSSNGSANYGVHIELKRLGRVLAENDTDFSSDGSSNTFFVYFRQPVQIDPDTYYTASAVLEGLELSFFGQEGMTDVTEGSVTFQFQCSAESTNGTGVQGGQIPEIIFYGPSSSSTTNSSSSTTLQN